MRNKVRDVISTTIFPFFLILALSAAARLLLSLFSKSAVSYSDELWFLELAQNIFRRGSFTVYTEPVRYANILYPLLISPFYAVTDGLLRTKLISAFNALLISSSLIPGYLLARRILKKNWQVILVLLILALSPNLFLSLTFMAENLYYPLLLWSFYAAYRFFTSKSQRPLHAFGLGLLAALLLLTREPGAAWAPALFAALAAAGRMGNKKSRKEALLPPGLAFCGFLFPLLLLKFTVFRSVSLFASVQAVFAHFTTASEVVYWLYAAFVLLLFFLVSVFFFPVALPFCGRKKLSPENRSLLLLSGVYVFCIALGASLALSLRNDFADPNLRVYLRCLLGAAFPFLLLFFPALEEAEPPTRKSLLLRLSAVYGVLVLLFLALPRALQPFDAPVLQFLSRLGSLPLPLVWICRLAAVLSAAALLLLWKKKGKQALVCVLLPVMLIVELAGSLVFARDVRRLELADPDLTEEAVVLDEYLDSLEGNTLVAAASDSHPFLKHLATVSDNDYAVTTFADLRSLITDEEGNVRPNISLSDPCIPCPVDPVVGKYTSLQQVDQVVTVGSVSLLNPAAYEEITPPEQSSVRVYRSADPGVLSLLDPRSCVPGEPILFYGEDPAIRYMDSVGFSLPEPSFTWTQEAEASFTCVPQVDEPCRLEAFWVWHTTNGAQSCQVLANDIPVFDGRLPADDTSVSFYIPAEAYAETGTLTLRFLFPDAREPGNGDPRLLAVAFESFTLYTEE